MNDIAVLSRLLQNRLDAALSPGERLVWVGQPILARYKRSAHGFLALSASTVYAITSERVILIGAGDEPDAVRSYQPEQLQQLERSEHGDGWGDLILETAYVSDGDGGVNTERHGLLAIAGVRRVHALAAALAKTLPLAPATPHPGFGKALMTPAIGAALPITLRQALYAELGPGEHLVWAAQPIPASYLKTGMRTWSFFIPWTLIALCLFGVFAEGVWSGAIEGWDVLMALGVPLMLLSIGISFLIQPFRMRERARSVLHAITSERALTIDTAGPLIIRTYAPAGLVHACCRAGPGGSGDLVLDAGVDSRTPAEPLLYRHGFMGIGEVRHVERLIGHLKQAPADGNWHTYNAL